MTPQEPRPRRHLTRTLILMRHYRDAGYGWEDGVVMLTKHQIKIDRSTVRTWWLQLARKTPRA